MTKESTYYRRRRRLPLAGETDPETGATRPGPEKAVLTTRYRWGAKRRKPHYIYYADGTFYQAKACATEVEDGQPVAWEHMLVPVADAVAWDAYPSQTEAEGLPRVVLHIHEGRAEAVGAEGTEYAGFPLLDGSEDSDYIESLLGFAPRRRRKMRGEE